MAEARIFTDWAEGFAINIPRAYWAGWEDSVQGLVLMEDLAARNVVFGNAVRPISVDQQAQTLELLATLLARWWQSPDLKALKNFSTVWQASDRVVMQMLEPAYFAQCMDRRRCKAITGPYRDRDRVLAGLRAMAKIPRYPAMFLPRRRASREHVFRSRRHAGLPRLAVLAGRALHA